MDILLQGGIMMWGILIISIVSTTIIIERFSYLQYISLSHKDIISKVRLLLSLSASVEQASANQKKKPTATQSTTIVSKKLLALLEERRKKKKKLAPLEEVLNTISLYVQDNYGKDDNLEKISSIAVQKVLPKLERFLNLLNTCASIAPLMGLLGTVLGMIESFLVISQGEGGNEMIAGGISQALFTTAFGLAVAIPCIVFYNAFSKKITSLTDEIELVTEEVILVFKKKPSRN